MRRSNALVLLLIPMFALAGCSGSSSEYCDTLGEDGAGARIFTPYVAWGSGPGDVDGRLAVMDDIDEPPADLAEEWDVWHAHLSAISEAERAGDAPAELISAGASGDAADAGKALSAHYTDACL